MIQPLNEQFARMQKLAGAQPTNKNHNKITYTKNHNVLLNFLIKEHLLTRRSTLLESQLTENKLKKFFSVVKDNFSKKQLPKLDKFLKSLTSTKKPAEALAALSALRNAGIDLKNKEEVAAAISIIKNKSLNEAKAEEPKWVTVNGVEGYYFDQPTDEEGDQTKEIFITKDTWKSVGSKLNKAGKTENKGVISSLNKFFTDTLIGKLLSGAMFLGTAYVGLADDIGNAVDAVTDIDMDGSDAASQETIRQLAKAGFSNDQINSFLNGESSADAGGQSGAALDDNGQSPDDNGGDDGGDDADDSSDDLGDLETDNPDLADAKKQGLDIDSDDNQTVNFIKFKNGSSQLDQDDLKKISQENADIIKFLKNGQNYSETILGASSHSANNSNVDAQGGDLNVNRANNTAEAAIDDIESQLKEDGIKYTRSGNTIELEDGGTYELKIGGGNDIDKLTQIDRTDDTATQSAIRVGEVGEKDAPVTPPNPTTLLGYDPLFDTYGGKKEKPSEKEKPSDEETPKTSSNKSDKTGVVLPPLDVSDKKAAPIRPAQAKQDVTNLSKLNRNGQIAMVLSRMSPKLNIFTQLGKNTITSLSDNDFKKIQDSNASETAKKLAKLIPNLRKSPDSFLKKVSALTGIELAPRAKAVATKPGANTQAPITQVTEAQIYLQEAAIDDLFSELGITPEEIKANRVAIIALLGSMYAADGNTDVSIVDPSKLSKQEQKELQGMGFAPQAGGNYVYMKPGDTAQQIRTGDFDRNSKSTKAQPDADKVGAEIGKRKDIQRYLKLINKKDELKDLVTGLIGIFNPKLIQDKTKLRSLMYGMRNRITEEEKDASTAIQNILKNPTLVTRFKNIDSAEEAIQVILREIIPFLSPEFLKNKSQIRGAIVAAANELTNTETAADRNEKATQNKPTQPIKESFTRMQKLAGIIK